MPSQSTRRNRGSPSARGHGRRPRRSSVHPGHDARKVGARRSGGTVVMVPMWMKPATHSCACNPDLSSRSGGHRPASPSASWPRSQGGCGVQDVLHRAPADSVCSSTGIFGWSFGLAITASVSGLSANCARPLPTCSGSSPRAVPMSCASAASGRGPRAPERITRQGFQLAVVGTRRGRLTGSFPPVRGQAPAASALRAG